VTSRSIWCGRGWSPRRRTGPGPAWAHLPGRDDEAVNVRPLLERAPRFADLIEGEADEAGYAALRGAETIGRPLGGIDFVAAIARCLDRAVTPRKRGESRAAPGASEM
jgi:putative transposase